MMEHSTNVDKVWKGFNLCQGVPLFQLHHFPSFYSSSSSSCHAQMDEESSQITRDDNFPALHLVTYSLTTSSASSIDYLLFPIILGMVLSISVSM